MKKILAFLLSVILILSVLICPVYAQNPEQTSDTAVTLDTSKTVAFQCKAERTGKFTVRIEYFVKEIHGSKLEFSLAIDSKSLDETYQLGVSYVLGEISTDDFGNQLTPEWSMEEKWYNNFLYTESSTSYDLAVFDLDEGEHILEFTLLDGAISIKNVELVGYEEPLTYEEYLKNSKSQKSNPKTEPITVPAESLFSATSKVILPFCDSSSAKVTPATDNLQIINCVGGAAWNIIGQEAVWQVDIEKDGWYSVSIRFRQDYTDGRATIRSLKIDGEYPFKECKAVEFPYKTEWTDKAVGQNGEAYRFYLTKGKHEISLTPAIGEMESILSETEDVLSEINAIYRKIIMITSSTPDTYRDYRLDEKIPDTLENLNTQSKKLQNLIERTPEGTNCAILERTVQQLKNMYKYKDTIAGELSRFQSNMSSIGTWINDQKTQPLALDEITVYSADTVYKKQTSGFLKSVIHSIKRFLYSFSSDYEIYEKNESIEVWVTTGRDQMQIIRRLSNETFTPVSDIQVDLRMIATTALLPAVVSGIGPDVALGEPNTTPVNFASRGAVYDLNQFSDAKEISERFTDAALTPLKYEGGLYALPETLNFNMMFYRTDIFAEYGWSVPKTWDDVRNLIFDLSKNNMQFGFTSGFGTYCMLLAQKGGAVYSENGSYSRLDEQPALKAFEEYTQFYSEYKIPVSFNFANRFRSGEMPIAITGYTAYNTLEVFAPEIKGLWDIAVVPGTADVNGSINHASTADGICAFILKDTKNVEASWEFLKWWTSADIQARYGNSVEEKLGAAARYAPANVEALAQIPWSTAFYNELSMQLENVVGIPEVPGGYFTPRNFNNAFRATVYDSQDARETLLQYVKVINDEITRKRKEFGLSVKE